jgi:hypothetical protein
VTDRVRVALGVLAVAALFALPAAVGVRILADPGDLRAFYCAGKAVAQHADPYRVEPLRSCEVRETLADGRVPFARLAVPAPLPGYALAPFALASFAPYAAVCTAYIALLVAAVATTIVLVAQLTGFRTTGVAAALILSDGIVSIGNGQIVPFALLALCASAWELSRGGYVRASAYAACAAIEPHLALPALLALAYAVPKTRVPVLCSVALLAAISLIALGLATNLEFVTQVLPLHAHSETSAAWQYSLTSLLARSGADPNVAIAWGELSYVAMCIFGVVVAVRLARGLKAPQLLVLLPPAFVLLGGPFVHLTQMAFAVPALLVLMRAMPERRTPLAFGLLLVAIPWDHLAKVPAGLVAATAGMVVLAIAVGIWRPARRTIAIVTVAFALLGAGEAILHQVLAPPKVDATVATASVDRPGALAEVTWTAFTAVAANEDERLYLASHAPTWAGIILMVAVASGGIRRAARSSERYAGAAS